MESNQAATCTPRRSTTMRDVAQLAGVSLQTVSRTLNEPDTVRPATRARIESAIEKLGYRRNLSARALKTNTSHLIGLLMPSGTLFGPSSMADAIHSSARRHGFACVTAHTDVENSEEELLSYFRTLGVAGIIVIAPTIGAARNLISTAADVPIVTIGANSHINLYAGLSVYQIPIDQEAGERLATQHLIEHGHTEIGFLAGPDDWFDAQARRRGWTSAMLSAGLSTRFEATVGWDAKSGYTAALELLSSTDRPNAFVCANDDVALGAIHAATQLGLHVPDDLAIIGFDNISNSAFFSPALTTVAQPFAKAGECAITAVVEDVANRDKVQLPDHPLEARLIVRRSCGCNS